MSDRRFYELMQEASWMDDSPAKVAVLEEAVRTADTLGKIRLGVSARMELVEAAVFSGAEERALVAFSWLLAQYDADSSNIDDEYSLLWSYKWIVGHTTDFPSIARERVLSLEDDLEARYIAVGYGRRAVNSIRAENAIMLGDVDRAAEYYEIWQATPRDGMADCTACETNTRARVLAFLGDHKGAIQVARPLLDGRLSCRTMPESTYGQILISLLRVGNLEKAAECHRKGFRRVTGKQDFLSTAAEHLGYLTYVQEFPKAIRCLERHLPLALKSANGYERLETFAASATLLDSLCSHAKRKKRKLRLPPEVQVEHEEGVYDLERLHAWFSSETDKLAQRFDARNGNETTSGCLEDRRAFLVNSD